MEKSVRNGGNDKSEQRPSPQEQSGYKPRTLQDIYRQMPEMEIPAGMAAARRERLQTQVQDLSRSIRILYDRGANHPDSMRILEENNLRPLTYKEALAILTENEEIKEQLKGKGFWIDGRGSDKYGYYHFDGNDLVKGRVADIEKNVRCQNGDQPQLFTVCTDDVALINNRRFGLLADHLPNNVTLAVIGLPK